MDLLQTCAVGFHQLLTYQYHIVAGRKGRTIYFTISFDPSDFHHLAGLHKLTDNVRFLTGKRANIMQEILSGNLTLSHAQRFFSDSGGLPAAKQFRGYTGILISGTAYGRGHAGMPYLFPKIGKGLCRGSAALYLAEKRKTQSTDRRHYHPIR